MIPLRGMVTVVTFVCLVGLGGASSLAQQKAPLALAPAETFILVQSDGDSAHQAAWEKTAAYEAFRKSGLMDAFVKTFRELMSQIPDERGGAVLEIVDFLSEHGLTAAIGVPPGKGPAIPYLTVVAHDAGPHGGVLDQFIEILGDDAELKHEQVSGRMVSRVVIPQTPGVELAWWTEGDHLVLTLGLGAVDAAIQVSTGKSANFAASATGKKLAAKPTFERTGLCFVNMSILRDRFGDIPLPVDNIDTVNKALEIVGLDSLNSVLIQSGYNGRALWSTIDIDAPAPRTGLLGLADPKSTSMTLADLPPLPQNHVGFFAQSFSLANSYDRVLELVKTLATLAPAEASEQIDSALEQLPEILGCDLRNDILAHLGPVQCVYTDANQGMLGAETGLILQVANAAKLRASIDKILKRLEDQFPTDQVKAIQRDKHGQKLITIQFGGGISNPTLLISDKWVCLGSAPQTVEAFALRLKGDLPVWKPDAEANEALAAVPKKFSSISVAYPRQAIRLLVSIVPYLYQYGQVAMSQAHLLGVPQLELSVTAMDIPPAEVVIKPLFPNVAWGIVDETGIHWTSRNSSPGVPAVGGADGTTVAVVAVGVALLLPAVQQAREAARRTQSRNNLKIIGLGLHNHHDFHQHFPAGTIPSKKLKPEERQSWLVPILPYLDQAAVYDQMKVNLKESARWDDDDLQDAIQLKIPTFVNPSNLPGFESGEPATTDYAGWAGVGKDAPTEKCKPEKKGIFGYDRTTRIRDITDGASNTVMVSDVVPKTRGPWAQGGSATIRALTTKPYINGDDGIGSPHKGGFHILLADGSVRFISDKIQDTILEALATRAGDDRVTEY